MGKFFNGVKSKVSRFINQVRTKTSRFINQVVIRNRTALANKRGEGFLDSGFKILIAVVIASLLLAALYALFKDTLIPKLNQKVTELFNYSG